MNRLQASRLLILTSYFGLLLLVSTWHSLLSPPDPNLISLSLLLYVGPLLLPLWGILYDKTYTYGWTLFLMMFYFAHGTVEAYSSVTDRWLALCEALLASLLFVMLIVNIRLRKKERQKNALSART